MTVENSLTQKMKQSKQFLTASGEDCANFQYKYSDEDIFVK